MERIPEESINLGEPLLFLKASKKDDKLIIVYSKSNKYTLIDEYNNHKQNHNQQLRFKIISKEPTTLSPDYMRKDLEEIEEDLEIETFRSSGPGGQNVNKVETGTRLIHKPSGLVVSCQSERSQFKNREKALELLKARLYDLNWTAAQGKISEERRQQIGSADRSEKIKTYNFPQDRLTDHRYKKNFHNLEEIMDGDLDPVFEIYHRISA